MTLYRHRLLHVTNLTHFSKVQITENQHLFLFENKTVKIQNLNYHKVFPKETPIKIVYPK